MRYELILGFKEIYPNINNMLMWRGLAMKYCHVGRRKSPQHTTSKTLLNMVHVIVCYVLWPTKIKLLDVFNAFFLGVRKEKSEEI